MASPFGNTGVTNCAICLEGLVFICTLTRSSDNLISYAPLAGNLRQALITYLLQNIELLRDYKRYVFSLGCIALSNRVKLITADIPEAEDQDIVQDIT